MLSKLSTPELYQHSLYGAQQRKGRGAVRTRLETGMIGQTAENPGDWEITEGGFKR